MKTQEVTFEITYDPGITDEPRHWLSRNEAGAFYRNMRLDQDTSTVKIVSASEPEVC